MKAVRALTDRDSAVKVLVLGLETRLALHLVPCSGNEVYCHPPEYARAF
jgi:hypothetical protein